MGRDSSLIIINADDYGLTDGICTAINQLIEVATVTSTSVMICAEGAADRVARWITPEARLRCGVHLQLTNGTPRLTRDLGPSLVAEDGSFIDPRTAELRPTSREVYLEWRAQIREVERVLGKKPDHLDCHHGMHRRSAYLPVYLQLAREFSVPVRSGPRELVKKIRDAGTETPDGYVRDWSGSWESAASLIRKIEDAIEAGRRAIEVVTHPGYVDDDLRAVSSLNDERQHEFDVLCSQSFREWSVSATLGSFSGMNIRG